MDDHCKSLLVALMIATGHRRVIIRGDDFAQARDWSLDPVKTIGVGEGIELTISENADGETIDRQRAIRTGG